MSSSSTTACSRSPSPATPESSDSIEPALNQDDLSAWCQSLSPTDYPMSADVHMGMKNEDERILDLEDLLQEGSYDDSPAVADPYRLSLDTRSSRAVPTEVADMFYGPCSPASTTKPIPPPPSQPRKDPTSTQQRVVYPPKESCYNLPIMIPSIPEGGTKSRVETQVRLTVDLAHASASSGEPFKYDRVGSWKWLRLPKGTSTKKRTRKEGKVEATIEDTLLLTAEVTCASPPHTRVACCTSCQTREAKRVARKIAARVRPARSDSDSQDDPHTIPGRGRHEDTSNLVQFNCPEVLDFSLGSVILPLRITCYCRHHREKVGFNVHFTMLDHNGRIVGTGMTRPIMITDDHKSTGVNTSSKIIHGSSSNGLESAISPEWPYGAVGEISEIGGTSKRRGSRAAGIAERPKKRTKPYDADRTSGRLVRKNSHGSLASPVFTRSPTPAHSIEASSPLVHHAIHAQQNVEVSDAANAQAAADIIASFDASSPAEANMFDTDIIMPDSQTFDTPMFSLDQLTNASFMSPVPQSTVPIGVNLDPLQVLDVAAQSPYLLFNQDPPPPLAGFPSPKIHRLIPSSGPTYGGIEVTVLGANFHSSMQLNCVFGSATASSTQRWSENTLVCLLPPSATPGVVAVWFEGMQKDDGAPPSLFTYTDETDRALMELALQVVGLKMTGKIEDARNVAMRIVSTTGPDDSSASGNNNSAMQLSSVPAISLDMRHLLLGGTTNHGNFERLILDFLAVLDVPVDVPTSSVIDAISHHTSSGQTLLHLASFLKFPSLVEFLIEHEIDLDARDRNGYTALHFAALVGSADCAHLLLQAGAAVDVVNALGKTPEEIAPSGFFSALSADSSASESLDLDREEQAALGDVEEDSEDEASAKHAQRYRVRRKFTLREKIFNVLPHVASSPEHPSKKAAEAELVDGKQVVASFMETVQRALAQLQYPQGMIPQMPNLPLPHLGMPAWGALPQMPTAFPVLVPMPALSVIWGDKRDEEQLDAEDAQDGDKAVKQQQWLAIPTAQEWRAIWDKWSTQSITRTSSEPSEAPPAYTPRGGDEISDDMLKSTAAEVHEVVSENLVVARHVGNTSRRVEYDQLPVPEQEVQAFGYRPARKQSRKVQKKHDRMLVWFWIPILVVGISWALLRLIAFAFHAMSDGIALRNSLNVS